MKNQNDEAKAANVYETRIKNGAFNNHCFRISVKNTRLHFSEIDVTTIRSAKEVARAQVRAQAALQQLIDHSAIAL